MNEKNLRLPMNLFWDVYFDDIDFEKNAPYVILRVLEYGRFEDWKHTLVLYGKERIGEIDPNSSVFMVIKSLGYFEDAEDEVMLYMFSDLSWTQTNDRICHAVELL